MRRSTIASALLGLALPLTACPTAPAPLPPGAFADTTPTDTVADQDTATQCAPTCAGELAANGWFSAHGWELDEGVTRDDGGFLIGGADMPRVLMRGASWSGGLEVEVSFTVVDPGGAAGKLIFGAVADAPDERDHETVVAVVTLSGTTEAEADVSVLTGSDRSGEAQLATTSTDAVAVDASGEVTLTLTATCTDVSIAVAGGASATRALAAAVPDVDTLFLQTTGGATVRVTSVRMTNPACTPESPALCSTTSCPSVDEPCEVRDCTPLGACKQVPVAAGTTCTPDDEACFAAEGTCSAAGVCEAAPVDCDDDDPCTADTCSGGCQHAPLAAPDDGLDTSALGAAGL
ncbi:MAG: hypothetical protein EP329_06720, partial [Deltaproteobacteria bacterium]